MITEEQAVTIAKDYLKLKNRKYLAIDKVWHKENEEIYSDSDVEIRNVYVVSYDEEGFDYPEPYFIYIDSDTGEVLFTLWKHGRVEDRE